MLNDFQKQVLPRGNGAKRFHDTNLNYNFNKRLSHEFIFARNCHHSLPVELLVRVYDKCIKKIDPNFNFISSLLSTDIANNIFPVEVVKFDKNIDPRTYTSGK